uniref:Proline-rich transmembrane protein 3/4 domain-containing protein n=1 Tax=Salmo trutta TaxID=8032 RepID=A0A674CCA8_SALTR
ENSNGVNTTSSEHSLSLPLSLSCSLSLPPTLSLSLPWLSLSLTQLEIPTTPCNTTDQSWSPFYPNDIISNQSQRPFLSLTPPLFVPLYSDWNSALATWGFAWEAHIYGLGSVFTALALISVLCLLGLPLRCPPGSPYFTLLHLFLLATGGTRAFSLLYDAYSHQDHLPALGSLLLSELPFPCLTSAFSICFLLLSLRSRMPCLLFFLSLMHFGAFLGSIALFHVFPSLPVLLLLPQGVFILLCLLLPCSFLLFYCHVRQDAKHIQRLSDGEGEVTGSPVLVGRLSRCPFAEAEEWRRAARAGVGGALCLLGCGGLQLYGMLHALGLGGVSAGAGFQPWPWWAYQLGCRLCEVGVCLSLSIIGTQPLLFCWPSHPLSISPILPPHYPWSLGQKEKQVVCDVIRKRHSEALPLYTLMDPPSNGLNQLQAGVESQGSSQGSLCLDTDSTVDLRPPSPIDLSRSIDQALYSETLFPHSLFSSSRLLHASSSLSLNSPGCSDPCCPPECWWRGSNSSYLCQESLSGSSQGLFPSSGTGGAWSHPHTTRGQPCQSSLPRTLPHLTYHRRYHTLSSASQDSQWEGRLEGREDLSESRLLERDTAVQAEFVNVCRQIDALSVCSDTIDL